ncbi:MAG TPA: hypothetical protein VGX21_03140 [Methylomirabilota bacterium]|nr:hypothetical protein [Methylomirabilota bacterium]
MGRRRLVFGVLGLCLTVAAFASPGRAEAANILLFYSSRYLHLGADNGHPPEEQEADNVKAALVALGHTVTTIAGPDDPVGNCGFDPPFDGYSAPGTLLATADEYRTALASADVFLIPEHSRYCDMAHDITPDVVGVWQTWVAQGGGLVIHVGYEGRDKVPALLNVLFGFQLTGIDATGVRTTRTSAAAGTHFAAAPATLPGNNETGHIALASLPPGSASIYDDGTNASVAIIPYGAGKVILLGWDWAYSDPPFAGLQNGGWFPDVLNGAVEEAAGNQPPPPPPPALAPTVALHTSKTAARAGDLLQVNLTVANSGEAGQVDVYFGALLPPEAGLRLGCPGGDAVAFIADDATRIVTTCLSSSPAGFAPFFQGASLPGSLPETTLAPFWQFVLPPGLPAGTYTLFLALTPPGALLDGRIDPEDLLALTSASFTYSP